MSDLTEIPSPDNADTGHEGNDCADSQRIPTMIERYRLRSLLGSGASGTVYLAEDTGLGGQTSVALKLLNPELSSDETALRSLKREILLTRDLSHRNIVKVFEFGAYRNEASAQQAHFVVMELVDGTSLKSMIAKGNALRSPELAYDYLMQLLDGLAVAHAHNIIHRDIKPENILVDKDGILKIVDFGAAQSLLSSGTEIAKDVCIGSPYYMAPELFRGERPDARSDIYSVGILAYELATGQKPFQEGNIYKLSMQHMTKSLPALPHTVPSWLRDFIQRCTSKCQEDRFSDAAAGRKYLEKQRKEPSRRAVSPYRVTAAVAFLLVIIGLREGLPMYQRPVVYLTERVFRAEAKLGRKLPLMRWAAGFEQSRLNNYFIHAMENGSDALVESMLQEGVDINFVNSGEMNAFKAAARSNRISRVERVLELEAENNVNPPQHNTWPDWEVLLNAPRKSWLASSK